ncbi:hypothetical protein DMA11_15915 [Marinilabiliaceae bacterium JC017]|nr:hypothetical protein DMA11_15915 [Marinilabiliaceae bacterium JC017]
MLSNIKHATLLVLCLLVWSVSRADNLSLLIQKADSLQKQQSKEALPVMHRCLKLIEKEDAVDTDRVQVYKLLSAHFLKHELLDSAFAYCQLRLKWAQKGDLTDDIILSKTDLGEIHGKRGNYKKAFELLSEARELCESTETPAFQANILTNQAFLYYSFEKKGKSIQLLKEALDIYQSEKDTLNMSYLNNNLGILYKHQSNYDSTLFFLQQSYFLAGQVHDTLGMASACNNMGSTLSMFGDFHNAEKYLLKSLRYYQVLNQEELSLYSNLGRVYKEMGNSGKSIRYLNKALAQAYKQAEPKKILSLLKEVSDYYREIEDWQNALYYLDEYHQYKEQVYQKELPEIIDRIQAEADLKLKEKTIQLLTEKNNYQALYLKNKNGLIAVLIILLVAIIFLGNSLYARSRVESKRRELLMEQRLLRSQMNPHFFFNTLTSIQSFVIRNEARLAGKYIAKFARLMREILENSTRSQISMNKEISAMENYLSLQQMRMNNSFDYHIHVADAINVHAIEIPPMLIQPFIENAIAHGLNHLTDRKGILNIFFTINEDLLQVVVRDNGIGREKAAEINGEWRSNHKSLGSKITHERLKLLTNDKRKRSKLIIRDLYDVNRHAAGTEVELQLVFDKCR